MNWKQVSSCVGKRSFETAPAARKAIRKMGNLAPKGLSAYRCPYCLGYHLTRLRQSKEVRDAFRK